MESIRLTSKAAFTAAVLSAQDWANRFVARMSSLQLSEWTELQRSVQVPKTAPYMVVKVPGQPVESSAGPVQPLTPLELISGEDAS